MPPRERLPQQDADRPDVGCGPCRLACQPLRRDIGERSRHVARGRQRLLLGDEREPEIEQLHGDLDAVVQDLRSRLDRRLVVELAALERVSQGPPRHVLVGDVDVALVAGKGVGAQAVWMPKLGGCGRLALGPRPGGSGSRNDLERDLSVSLQVAGVPDRPHPAAAERAQRAVAAEDEPARGCCCRGLRHPGESFRVDGETPFPCKEWARVARIPRQSRP